MNRNLSIQRTKWERNLIYDLALSFFKLKCKNDSKLVQFKVISEYEQNIQKNERKYRK